MSEYCQLFLSVIRPIIVYVICSIKDTDCTFLLDEETEIVENGTITYIVVDFESKDQIRLKQSNQIFICNDTQIAAIVLYILTS